MSVKRIARWLGHECSKVRNHVLRHCIRCKVYKKWSSANFSVGRNSTSTNVTFLELETQENGLNENMENDKMS